jgi:hypothetical protein
VDTFSILDEILCMMAVSFGFTKKFTPVAPAQQVLMHHWDEAALVLLSSAHPDKRNAIQSHHTLQRTQKIKTPGRDGSPGRPYLTAPSTPSVPPHHNKPHIQTAQKSIPA